MSAPQIPSANSEGFLDGPHGQTWWRVTGDIAATRDSGRTPLVVLHGGPGIPHDYTLRIARLVERGRAVVHYDQIGCGRSTKLPDADPSFWTVQLFLDELHALLRHLEINEDYSVLGQSWGGMLAAEHAVLRPAGLRGLVLANSPASMPLWSAGVTRLRRSLPATVQATLARHEKAGTVNSPVYAAAERAFYDRHVLRVQPYPPEVESSFALLDEHPTVYHEMIGSNEFYVTGSLKEWSIIDRLHLVTAPTLVIRGGEDEATIECVAPFIERIAGARSITFENSSHMPHIEEEESYLDAVEEFLTTCDIAIPERTTP